jgi:hypothetical protein
MSNRKSRLVVAVVTVVSAANPAMSWTLPRLNDRDQGCSPGESIKSPRIAEPAND